MAKETVSFNIKAIVTLPTGKVITKETQRDSLSFQNRVGEQNEIRIFLIQKANPAIYKELRELRFKWSEFNGNEEYISLNVARQPEDYKVQLITTLPTGKIIKKEVQCESLSFEKKDFVIKESEIRTYLYDELGHWRELKELRYEYPELINDKFNVNVNINTNINKLITENEEDYYMPTREDFDKIRRQKLRERIREISINEIVNLIGKELERKGHKLRSDWRLITEINVKEWSLKNKERQ